MHRKRFSLKPLKVSTRHPRTLLYLNYTRCPKADTQPGDLPSAHRPHKGVRCILDPAGCFPTPSSCTTRKGEERRVYPRPSSPLCPLLLRQSNPYSRMPVSKRVRVVCLLGALRGGYSLLFLRTAKSPARPWGTTSHPGFNLRVQPFPASSVLLASAGAGTWTRTNFPFSRTMSAPSVVFRSPHWSVT